MAKYLDTSGKLAILSGGLLFISVLLGVTAFVLPYWIHFDDVIIINMSGSSSHVRMKFHYGFWRYCNDISTSIQSLNNCGAVKTHSDLEQLTICLVTLSIILSVNAFINTCLYLSLMKNEKLCLYIITVSSVLAGLLMAAAVINYGVQDHTAKITDTYMLPFTVSNLSIAFWLSIANSIIISIASVITLIALYYHKGKPTIGNVSIASSEHLHYIHEKQVPTDSHSISDGAFYENPPFKSNGHDVFNAHVSDAYSTDDDDTQKPLVDTLKAKNPWDMGDMEERNGREGVVEKHQRSIEVDHNVIERHGLASEVWSHLEKDNKVHVSSDTDNTSGSTKDNTYTSGQDYATTSYHGKVPYTPKSKVSTFRQRLSFVKRSKGKPPESFEEKESKSNENMTLSPTQNLNIHSSVNKACSNKSKSGIPQAVEGSQSVLNTPDEDILTNAGYKDEEHEIQSDNKPLSSTKKNGKQNFASLSQNSENRVQKSVCDKNPYSEENKVSDIEGPDSVIKGTDISSPKDEMMNRLSNVTEKHESNQLGMEFGSQRSIGNLGSKPCLNVVSPPVSRIMTPIHNEKQNQLPSKFTDPVLMAGSRTSLRDYPEKQNMASILSEQRDHNEMPSALFDTEDDKISTHSSQKLQVVCTEKHTNLEMRDGTDCRENYRKCLDKPDSTNSNSIDMSPRPKCETKVKFDTSEVLTDSTQKGENNLDTNQGTHAATNNVFGPEHVHARVLGSRKRKKIAIKFGVTAPVMHVDKPATVKQIKTKATDKPLFNERRPKTPYSESLKTHDDKGYPIAKQSTVHMIHEYPGTSISVVPLVDKNQPSLQSHGTQSPMLFDENHPYSRPGTAPQLVKSVHSLTDTEVKVMSKKDLQKKTAYKRLKQSYQCRLPRMYNVEKQDLFRKLAKVHTESSALKTDSVTKSTSGASPLRLKSSKRRLSPSPSRSKPKQIGTNKAEDGITMDNDVIGFSEV